MWAFGDVSTELDLTFILLSSIPRVDAHICTACKNSELNFFINYLIGILKL